MLSYIIATWDPFFDLGPRVAPVGPNPGFNTFTDVFMLIPFIKLTLDINSLYFQLYYVILITRVVSEILIG